MVYKVDGNPHFDSRDWSMYSNILNMYSVKWKLLKTGNTISLKFLHHSCQQPKPLRYKETVLFALDLKTAAGICSARDRS